MAYVCLPSLRMLQASDPGELLRLVVRVQHPEHGADFFHAVLSARRSVLPEVGSEQGGLRLLLRCADNPLSCWPLIRCNIVMVMNSYSYECHRYGFQPHRVAMLIYWQALVLLWKGLPLYGLPSRATKEAAATGATHPKDGIAGHFFTWRSPPRWPWNASSEATSEDTPGSPPGPKSDPRGVQHASNNAQIGKEGDSAARFVAAAGCPFSSMRAVQGSISSCPVANKSKET